MKQYSIFAVSVITAIGLAYLPNGAVGQQAMPTHHKYFLRAVLTIEGMKDIQKRSATVTKAGVAKLDESVGGKLESWYFDPNESTAYMFIDYPDDIAVATILATVNGAGFARVTAKPVLSAEDEDRALTKSLATRPPQQQ
jgi:hypothetical protein